MAPSADPGVSTRSEPPTPQTEKVSPSLGSPPDLPSGAGGDATQNRGRQRPPRWQRLASNLPVGSGLDWRAELPSRAGGEAGVRSEVAERWEQRCGGQPSQLGARWRSAVWEGGPGAERGRSRWRGLCCGYWGVTQPGGLSRGRGKLLA